MSVAIGMMAQELWPNILIEREGSQISSIGEHAMESDLENRRYAADIFVVGHAFLDRLDRRRSGHWPNEVLFVRGKSGSTLLYTNV
jgi:hypothetical protein